MGRKQPLGERRRRAALVLLMAVVCLTSTAIAVGLLYQAALDEQSERLRETAQSHARLIEALARHAAEHHGGGAGPVVLAQLRDAHGRYAGFGKTGELTLARREGDRIVYLLSHRHYDLDDPEPVPFASDRSDAMQMALENRSGVLDSRDYRGARVLAAHEPIAGLGWGITVKMDVAEVRAPFVVAGSIAGALALLLCILAALAFARITDPLIRSLQTGRERLAFALDAGEIGLYDWDLRTNQAMCSERYSRMRGLEPGAHVPLSDAWMAAIHPDDRERVRGEMAATVESGAPHDLEYRVLLPGGETRWLHSRALVFSEPGARPHRIIGVAMDITARIEAEVALRRANDELERRVEERTGEILRKNRDLETLLYVTSHDLREPLRAIRNFSQMVCDRYAERLDDKGRDFLRRVVAGGERMERLIDDVLQLSRAQRTMQPTDVVDTGAAAREALRSLDTAMREKGARVRISGTLPLVQGDAVWVTRALYNLIANALKFVRDGEAPDVEIVPLDKGEIAEGLVGIAVRDRGPGVNPEYAERIFGLFQRAVGREVPGTGAGLAIVREVADRHGGRAWVNARDGGGAEFIITFRLAQRGGAGDPPLPPVPPATDDTPSTGAPKTTVKGTAHDIAAN